MIFIDFKNGKKFKNHLHRWLFDIAISQFYQNIAKLISTSNFCVFGCEFEHNVMTRKKFFIIFFLNFIDQP